MIWGSNDEGTAAAPAVRGPGRLVEVWAAGSADDGRCGTGWVVGHYGVLTCRHVVEPFLASAGHSRALQVRLAASSSVSDWVDCRVAWSGGEPGSANIVLLEATPGPGQSWTAPADPPSRLADVGQRPFTCVAIGFPEASARSSGIRDSEQALGLLLPAGNVRDVLIPFDIDNSVPDEAALWNGFSGAAVADEHDRLVGLVAQAKPDRGQRRLLVLPVKAAADDPDFAVAAARTGLNPVVEDFLAPLWATVTDPRTLSPAGVPQRVCDISNLEPLGVHTSSAGDTGTSPDYVSRDVDDAELRPALARATTGGQRFILIVGDSAAGKSRTAYEALLSSSSLRSRRLIVPAANGLARLLGTGVSWHDAILWLDDLDKRLSRGLEIATLQRVLATAPGLIIVATMRTSQLGSRQSEMADPAWEYLTSQADVWQVNLAAELSETELATAQAHLSDLALLSALEDGVGLGEWLVAGPELMKKLRTLTDLDRALANVIIAWYRTGLNQPLPEEDARAFWAEALPERQRQRLLSRQPDEQLLQFQKAAKSVCEPVITRDLFQQALAKKTDAGEYVAHDYVVDHVLRDDKRTPVPDLVWQRAVEVARSRQVWAPEVWKIGLTAFDEGAFDVAVSAMELLAEAGNVRALFNVGVLLEQIGRTDDALATFDRLIDRFGDESEVDYREQVAKALIFKGMVLGRQDQHEAELAAYRTSGGPLRGRLRAGTARPGCPGTHPHRDPAEQAWPG